MGKSEGEGNAVFLADTPEVIRKKVMRAVTDSGPTAMNQEKPESIANLFQLMKLVSDPTVTEEFDHAYNNCTIRYGDMKKKLAEDMITYLAPIAEKIRAIESNDRYILQVMDAGRQKAAESANQTLTEVRQVMGFRKYY
jgi:tryptophanyl-tRNA synthetase